jgi:hypothetical protein
VRHPPPAAHERGAAPTWLRRNRWGLLALVPALVLALWPSGCDGYARYRASRPREPVTASRGGWVTFAGARMRLVELVPAGDLADFGGRPVPLPEGTRAWRARIAFEAPRTAPVAGCRLTLEDTAGRTFEAGPAELQGARIPFAGCAPEPADGASPAFETVAHFLLPTAARPAAVRVTVATQLPRYARLIAG